MCVPSVEDLVHGALREYFRPRSFERLGMVGKESGSLRCRPRHRDQLTVEWEIATDYLGNWESRTSIAQFGNCLLDSWASEYTSSNGARNEDLVVVDPGNGFNYIYDLADSLRGRSLRRSPRVVGVWGLSQPGGHSRDIARMQGFPRPGRGGDDRGHLIAFAAGGGYDINLVPMDTSLNRGWSSEGSRFRGLERLVASLPGTVYFIRPIYEDDSDRPARFEVGAQVGEDLRLDMFINGNKARNGFGLSAIRHSTAFPVSRDVVAGCLDLAEARDQLFAMGWHSGPSTLTTIQRCTIAGRTGHIAESVTELLLDTLGWQILWHFASSGRHGVDLVLLGPNDCVVVVEVKGTLVPGRVPRLSRRELVQMSAEWVDKTDNPGMAELGLTSEDVYGGVIVVNFADLTWRGALTADFVEMHPVRDVEQLCDLSWLTAD